MKTSSNNLVVKDFVLINGFVVDVNTIATNENKDLGDDEKIFKDKRFL
jgi:hypothetical protein